MSKYGAKYHRLRQVTGLVKFGRESTYCTRRAESLGSRPSHNPFRIIAKVDKTGYQFFSIHSPIQAPIELKFEDL